MSWSDLPLAEFERIADCLGNRYMEFMDNAARDETSEADSYGTPEREGEIAIRELLKRLEKMRGERDEARQKICEMESECIIHPPCSPQQYARRMGWDCYMPKEQG